jgi:hypothetical protein
VTKSMITKLFVGSLIAIAGGLVLSIGAGLAAYANGALIMSGPDVVGIEPTAFAWTMLALAVLGCLAMFGGGITQFVAWIAAMLNTSMLEDKTWFLVLLVLGLLSFGFVAMLVYVLVGPDGSRATLRSGQLATATPTT